MIRAAIAIGALLISFLMLEGACRLFGIDEQFIRSALFYQQADVDLHRCAADAFLHYELKPGAAGRGQSRDSRPTQVHIGPSGARLPEHPTEKQPGTFRILCFGGSTMYGAGVNDDETIPAALERRLAALAADAPAGAPRRYEVWNFGTSAYTLGQAAHLARTQLAALDPDLIVVQVHNVGRRPFLAGCGLDIGLDTDGGRSFFEEQFPVPGWISPDLHFALVRHLALYRMLISRTVRVADGSPCEYCDHLSQREAQTLVREGDARDVPVLFLGIPYDRGAPADSVYRGLPPAQFVDLYQPNREPDFYEVHPPAAVLDEFASLLVNALHERGRLQSRGAPAP